MGILPRWSERTLAGSLSTQMTSLPFSARQAPATRPTYPLPTTAIFIRSGPSQPIQTLKASTADQIVNPLKSKELSRFRGAPKGPCYDAARVRIVLDYRPAL